MSDTVYLFTLAGAVIATAIFVGSLWVSDAECPLTPEFEGLCSIIDAESSQD